MKDIHFPKINLSKKQILLITIPTLLLALTLTTYLILKRTDITDKSTQEGYANDTIENSENIYQPIIDSDVVFNIYGEVGWDNESGTIPAYLETSVKCEEEVTYEEVNAYVNNNIDRLNEKTTQEDLEREYLTSRDLSFNSYNDYYNYLQQEPTRIHLSDEPVQIKNHCIVTLSGQFDISRTWNDNENEFTQNPELSAYVELPDGSLLTINGSSTFQINIYDDEIRVVLEEGLGYFRIAQQTEGKIFTVQVGDKVYKTEGGTELYAYSVKYINNSRSFQTEFPVFTDTEGYDEFETYFNQDGTSNSFAYLAGIKTISGDGDIYQRGTETKIEKSKNEYRFAYYYKYTYTTDEKGGYTLNTSDIPALISLGTYVSNDLDSTMNLNINNSKREYYALFVQDQKALNKIDMGFEKIVTNSNGNIAKMMTDYIAYYTNLGTEELTKRETNSEKDTRPCSGVWFLEDSENCGCRTGWTYIREAKGCCPNGSTYSSSRNTCITTITTSSCPFGTYEVGNGKCCKTGYTLSSDGTKCISKGNTTDKTPTYYPDSSSTDLTDSSSNTTGSSCQPMNYEACFPMNISNGQCPNGIPSTGFFVKDGECCHTVNMVCTE